ncbi:MAG: transglutaminase [Paracoccus sp.]|nr:MAG: transglutaminase [Paracoccus sp. (in: a-proteobacteria)]
MLIRAGFDLVFQCAGPTPIILLLNVHPSREADLQTTETLSFSPELAARDFLDQFGNRATRIVAPPGQLDISHRFNIVDDGEPDRIALDASQIAVDDLPDSVLPFLYASRYCETDLLMDFAWSRFGQGPLGWPRVQAICDFVHDQIAFDYQAADATRSAARMLEERVGVCRDFTHLAVALCRCMNIPARYCTGYLGDIGVPPAHDPMDFSAWFEVWLDGRWWTFDARHNTPRIGRILMATGRDAADVALSTSFGFARLAGFSVVTELII